MTEDNGTLRTFDTGATRDTSEGKLDYEGFLSPLVLERFAQYMHENRVQTDGSLRDSDNWQKGIPKDAYMKSLLRHFMDLWKMHRGHYVEVTMPTVLCAIMFNVMGYLHVVLSAKNEVFNQTDAKLILKENEAEHERTKQEIYDSTE